MGVTRQELFDILIQITDTKENMTESELEISTRAYCKMVMHAAKYPSSSINGVLLSKVGGGSNPVKYMDCIPMLHINTALAPMVEVALAQIESEVSRCGLVISGMYHAHDNLRDNHVDTFSQKIADKIADNVPGSILLNIDTHALIVQQHDSNIGKWRKRDSNSVKLEHDSVTLQCATAVIHKKMYRDLVDFDMHLDDISLDYKNVDMNMEIDSCL